MTETVSMMCRTVSDALRAADVVSRIQPEDKSPWLVEAKPYAVTRTERQNRYLWGWLYRNIASQLDDAGIVIQSDDGREFPYTKDLLHEIFKEEFLCYAEITRTNPKTGETKTRKLCYSTADLVKHSKTDEDEKRCFATYVQNIKNFCRQVWGIEIPPTYNEELLELDREAA